MIHQLPAMRKGPIWNAGKPAWGLAVKQIVDRFDNDSVEFSCQSGQYAGRWSIGVSNIRQFPVKRFKPHMPPLYVVPIGQFDFHPLARPLPPPPPAVEPASAPQTSLFNETGQPL